MATNKQKPATEEVKIDLFEDDDEFEEFEIDQASLANWDEKKVGEEITQQWEDDLDDDDANDDFALQLRKELENNPAKNEAKSS